MLSAITAWALAFLLGVRHASEPDHVAALATLVPEQRPSLAHAARLGVSWGFGHALTLLGFGGALLCLRLSLSERMSDWLELAVAALLIGLGARSLRRAREARRAGFEAQVRPAGKPLLIGMLHGLAGSGSLSALVIAEMPSIAAGMAYMAFFASGAVLGMALLTGLAGTPLTWLTRKSAARAAVLAAAGALSIAIGTACAAPIVGRMLASM